MFWVDLYAKSRDTSTRSFWDKTFQIVCFAALLISIPKFIPISFDVILNSSFFFHPFLSHHAVVLLDTTKEATLEWTRYPYGPQAQTPGVSISNGIEFRSFSTLAASLANTFIQLNEFFQIGNSFVPHTLILISFYFVSFRFIHPLAVGWRVIHKFWQGYQLA